MDLWFSAYFALGMFASALQSKALGVSVCFCLGLVALYPDQEKASLLAILFLPAYMLAAFRE